MTISATTPFIEYVENGATLTHPIPFEFNLESEVVVSRIDPVMREKTVLQAGADYSVTGGGGSTGSIAKTSAGTVGTILRVQRVTVRSQTANYVTGDDFSAETHEAALDRSIAVAQEQDVAVAQITARALRVPDGGTIAELPPPVTRMNKYLKFDNGGDPGVGDALGGRGDPGGNVMSIGLFTDAPALTIPVGTDLVQTSGYEAVGVGQAQYAYDAAVDAAYVVLNPRTSFVDAAGRGFKRDGGLVLTANVNGLVLEPHARIAGGTVDASTVAGYSSSAVLIPGIGQPSIDDPVYIDNQHILGPAAGTGTGLHLLASGNDTRVTFSRVRGAYISGFATGLKLEGISPGAGQWAYVNANQIEAHFYNCVRAIDIVGNDSADNVVDGNRIFSIVQPGAADNAEQAIRDAGEGNFHINFTWDWYVNNVAPGALNKAIEFVDKGTFQGGWNLLFTNVEPWKVWDNAGDVSRRSKKIFYGSRFIGFSHIASAPFTSSFSEPVGNQDDYAVAADKRFALYYRQSADRITWSADAGPAAPGNMFSLKPSVASRALYAAMSGYKRILIDFGVGKKLTGAFVAFVDALFADTVTMRWSNTATADPDAVVWTDMCVDVPGSRFVQPCIESGLNLGTRRWLCIELYKSVAADVAVERLAVFNNGEMGQAYLPREGGAMYGAMDFASATAADRAIKMNGVKVLGDQRPAVADAAAGTEIATINAILAAMRAHGLVANA